MAKLAFTVDADYQKVIKLREEIDRLKSTLSGMDGNTSPGSLRAMETQLAQNTKEFDRLVVAAVKTGHELEANLKKKIFEASQSVNTFSDKIIDQRVVVREVEADVKNLASSYAKLGKLDPSRGKLLTELNAARTSLNEEKATLFGLQQEQSKSRLSVKRLRDEYALYNNESKDVQSTNSGMSVSFGKVLSVIGGVSVLKELASEITSVTGQFQRFENVLTNALGGDNNKAKTYLGDIADFAAKTNFQLDELTDNFLKFVNRGVTPTMDSMTKLGDFTNSVSKPYAQLSEAILDINNPERWKEFGVQVQTNGSKVNLTFRGMKVEADRTVESVMKAIEQFGSMDGIKGSTEAIAGTIEGQMSNLKDTIASALNEIGQANAGIISGGISMTSGLIENYDKVGRALVALIGVYGVYRTAVMLAIEMEKGYAASQVLKIRYLLLAEKAQKLFNATMLSNPYVAVTALVVGLAAGVWALSNSTTAAEKAQKHLNDAAEESEKAALSEQRELAKLKGELAATTKGTDEYNRIKDEIVSKYGKYDKNLKDEIDKVGLLDTTYQNLTKSIQQSFDVRQYEKFKQEQGSALDEVMSNNLGKIQDRLYKDLGDEEGSRVYTKIRLAILEGKELDNEIKSTLDKVQNKGTVLANSQIDSYIRNIKDAQKVTDEFDQKARVKFGINGKEGKDDGREGEKKELSSVSEEIKTVTADIVKFKQELEDLRSGETTAEAGKTIQSAIEDKTKELKAAEDALSTLTGQTTKETDKLLKTQTDLSRSILDSEIKLQAGRISAMEEGKSKRIEIAKQEYQETLATICKEKEEYEKNLKETGGKKDPAVLSTFDNRESAARDKKNTDLAKIDKEYAEEYKERTKALTDVFLNEEERKLAAVKDRYSKERKWADEQLTTGGMTTEEHKSYTTTVDQAQMKENYNTLLSSLNDFKQQEKSLREKWDTDIAAAVETKDAYLVARLMEGKQKALSALNSQMLQESSEWMRLFGNLDTLTVDELNKLIDSIQKQLDSGTLKLNPVDAKALMDSLNQAKDKVAEKSPFQALAKSSGEMKKALADLKKAEDDGLTGEALDEYKTKVKNSAENVKKSIAAIGDAYGKVRDVMQSAADMISMVDEGLGETVNNAMTMADAVMGIGDVVAQAVIGFANGMSTMETASVILLIIKAVLVAVMAAIALFNGDKKHEKKIKEMQGQVDALERSYDKLGRAIDKTYSREAADMIGQQNENLEKQNELLQQQIAEEEAKKKTDKDKIKDWQNAIEDNNQAIEENKEKAVDAIFGSDIQSAIDDFASAYADAWAAGEDRATAMKDVVKNMIKGVIMEMLKLDLKPTVEALRKKIDAAMVDGIITDAEQAEIDALVESAVSDADKKYAPLDKYLKEDKSPADILGTSSDSLADTIIDGLAAGKSGIVDFSDSFEDMMRDAILNSLKAKYLEGPLKEFQKKFAELSESGGQLTEAEIEELRSMYADIIDGAKVQFDGMKDIAGLDFTADSENSLKGTFAKASEESITLLAGQTGASRKIQEEILNSMIPIREQMQAIRDMNVKGWEDVKAIRDLTTKIDKNTEQVAENTRQIKEVADKVADNTRNTVDALEGTINVKIKGM